MAKRVPIFVDPVLHLSVSEESTVAREEPKSVGRFNRRRSSSLDTSTKSGLVSRSGKHKNRQCLAEKVHIDRKRLARPSENVLRDKTQLSKRSYGSEQERKLQEHPTLLQSQLAEQEKLEQEISRLKTSLAKANKTCDTYKDQYNAAASTAKELQKQLDEVAGLQRAITEAHKVQIETSQAIKKAHTAVLSFHQRTKLERQKLPAESNKENTPTEGPLSAVDAVSHEPQKPSSQLEMKQKKINELEEKITAIETQWKSEVSELQQSLESSKHQLDKQSHHLDRLQKLVTYQKSEIAKLNNVMLKNESLEAQLKTALEANTLLEHDKSVAIKECDELKLCNDELKNQIEMLDQRGTEMEHEREVVNCQLQQQLEDVSSVSDVLSALSCEIKVLYHTLSEQSKWWLQKLDKLQVTDGDYTCLSFMQDMPLEYYDTLAEKTPNNTADGVACLSGQPLCSSWSLRTDNSETASVVQSAQRHLEDTPNSPSPTYNTSSMDASCYMTPVACQVPTATSSFSPEPILPSLQSISANPGFSAFTRVLQEPVCTQPDEANSCKSPHKGDDEGSESSDGIIELHSTESNEHVLINQADEAVSAYGNLQNLIHGLSGTIRQALSCYDLKLCSLDDKCRRFNAELMRERHLTCDAKSAACVATQAVESLHAELTAVKQSRDQLDADLRQAHELLRKRTQSLMQYFDQSVAVESLKKQLAAEQQLSARHADENATLRQTVTRLTALAQGSATSANPKDTWAEIVSENHRLRADKSSLFRRLNETESSLTAENKQLSRMHRDVSDDLKRAEYALSQLDEKVERVRQALSPHVQTLQTDPLMNAVMMEIGVFSND